MDGYRRTGSNLVYGSFFLAGLVADEAELRQGNSSFSSGQGAGGKHRNGIEVAGALVACLLLTIFSGVTLADEPVYDLDIPAMNAAEALNRFAEQTGAIMLFPYDLASARRANAVTGRYTLLEGLDVLLLGTGLSGGLSDKRVVSISPAENEQRLEEDEAMIGQEVPLGRKIAAFVASIFTASAASGQDVDAEGGSYLEVLEEIVVTAQKREQRLIDVPMSIAVISNQDIERRGLIGMKDYLRSIPGVNQIDKGSRDNAIVIRGVTTSLEFENLNAASTVATYFGETPISGAAGRGAGGIDVRLVDIERIEVLRGPQGTAYGNSSLGGAVRIVPAKPKLDSFGVRLAGSYSDTSGFGSGNSTIQSAVNIPLVTGQFGVRAVGYRYDESGFYRNIAGIDPATIAWAESFGLGDYVRGDAQDDVGRMLSTGGRLAALWQASEKLNLSMNFLTQKIEQDGLPLATIGKFEKARGPMAPQTQERLRGEGEIADTEMDLLNLVLNYDLGSTALTSAVSWIDSGSAYSEGLGLDYLSFLGPASNSAQSGFKSVTAEVRLISQFEGRFQFLGGLFSEDVDEEYVQYTGDWPGTPATNPFGTDPMFLSDVARQLEQHAIFGEVSYDLTDKLTATVGGRYFKYEKDQSMLFEGGVVGTPIGGGTAAIMDSSESGSSFKANLTYKPTQDSLLYASWAEGFRLGRPDIGLSSAVCDTDGDGLVDGTSISIESTRTINSDFLGSYEIGGKFTLFDRRMAVDASVYHVNWDGLPIRTVAPCSTGPLSYTANVGAASSDGVEFQASFLLAEGVRLDFGAGYTKAELSEDAPGLAPPAFKGDRLPGSPEVSASLAAQYDFDVGGYEAFIRADSFYTGEFYSDLLESPNLRAGDYIKVDARAGVEINDLSVELFVRNLTDEDAFTWRSILGGGGSHRLRPRTVGILLGYSFE